MAKSDWALSIDGNTVTLIYTSYGETTFTVEALETGMLRITENYTPSSSKNISAETSIAIAAVGRHTIDVYNV